MNTANITALPVRRVLSAENKNFMALLSQGYSAGLIDKYVITDIEQQITLLLSELITKYTYGESTSVKTETAFNILSSIYYTLDVFTAVCHKENDILNYPVREMFVDGQEIIHRWVAESQQLYQDIIANKLNLPLTTYHESLTKAIPDFFKHYNPLFGAHDTTTLIDYPLVFDDMSRSGIIYIKNYLELLRIETQFCRCFDEREVNMVLEEFARRHDLDLNDAPLNLFELLFQQSVAATLCGTETMLRIESKHIEQLQNKLRNANSQQVRAIVQEALNRVISKLNINSPELWDYLKRYEKMFTARFLEAFKHDNLEEMFVVVNSNRVIYKTMYSEGSRISDNEFTELVDMLFQDGEVSQKAALISSTIHSLGDFIDLLNSGCLLPQEMTAILTSLRDGELAVLGKEVFQEELKDSVTSISIKSIQSLLQKTDIEWYKAYISMYISLPFDRRTDIVKMARHLR